VHNRIRAKYEHLVRYYGDYSNRSRGVRGLATEDHDPAVITIVDDSPVDRRHKASWGKEQVDHYTNVHYHQPSDEYDPNWNLSGMIEDALVGFWTGLAIANADEMPTWNAGDEFEAVRLEALAAQHE